MDFTPCQLAVSASVLPSDANWVFEPKYDGYRCQLVVRAGKLQLFTRNGLDWTHRLGRSLPAEVSADHHFAFDGEICALDRSGRPDFGLLCEALSDRSIPLSFFAFDLIAVQGVSLTALPFLTRKQRLREVISELGVKNINFVAHTADGIKLSEALRQARWEGVMAKDAHALYLPGARSPAWRKIKFTQRQEFIVAGWRPDPATGDVKSIVLATLDGGTMKLRGSVGSGFSSSERNRLAALFSKLAQPFEPTNRKSRRDGIILLRPELVAEVEFLEFSSKGCVRGPSFIGLREDKRAADVCRETWTD
ncbi:non-homologous end-joining DNA ligase [Mesorhizobium sp. 128a]